MEFPIDRQPFPLLPHVDHGYLGGLVPALFAHRFLGSKQKLCRGILACSGAPACRWSRSILRKSGSTHNGKQYTIAKAIVDGRTDRSAMVRCGTRPLQSSPCGPPLVSFVSRTVYLRYESVPGKGIFWVNHSISSELSSTAGSSRPPTPCSAIRRVQTHSGPRLPAFPPATNSGRGFICEEGGFPLAFF